MLFKNLSISKNYKGPLKNEILPQNKIYLFGIRKDRGVIDLDYTLLNLKRSLKLFQAILQATRRQSKSKILFFINDPLLKPLSSILEQQNAIQVITKKWVPGTLTQRYSNRNTVPLVIVFSQNNNISIARECERLKIPTIFFANLNFNLSSVDYAVPTNEKNIQSLYFLISLFRKTYE